jgi:hypothetical protein
MVSIPLDIPVYLNNATPLASVITVPDEEFAPVTIKVTGIPYKGVLSRFVNVLTKVCEAPTTYGGCTTGARESFGFTVGGMSVTTANKVSLLTVFVAVMVSVCCVLISAGAVYNALDVPFCVRVPTPEGFIDQTKDAGQDAIAVTVYCCDC